MMGYIRKTRWIWIVEGAPLGKLKGSSELNELLNRGSKKIT
jgi:hypothetical protein